MVGPGCIPRTFRPQAQVQLEGALIQMGNQTEKGEEAVTVVARKRVVPCPRKYGTITR